MKKNTKVGVIVARFQTSRLTPAHISLITHALSKNDRVVIILGESRSRLSIKNPLSAPQREKMINDTFLVDFGKIYVTSISDSKSDKVWSDRLDLIIGGYAKSSDKVTIYSGRNGFSEYYTGVHKVENVSLGIDHISATDHRSKIYSSDKSTEDFREGIIFASNYRYPVSFQTVDIAIMDDKHHQVLLARKAEEKNMRFIGGFVDVSDKSLEDAARREVSEETGTKLSQTANYKYLGSYRIDDWRYRGDKDGVMTAFFVCIPLFETSYASDDIAELKWVKYADLEGTQVEPEHEVLKRRLLSYLKNETKTN